MGSGGAKQKKKDQKESLFTVELCFLAFFPPIGRGPNSKRRRGKGKTVNMERILRQRRGHFAI